MRKFAEGSVSMMVATIFAGASSSMAQQKVVPVWTGVAPGSEKWTQKEETVALPPIAGGGPLIRNATQPTLTAFLPDAATATRTAIVVCPGGGFQFLSWEQEGTGIAKWLSSRGIAAFVLKHRLIDTGPAPEDFQKSVAAMQALIQKLGTAPLEKRTALVEPMQQFAAFAIADGLQAIRVVREHASEWNIAPDRIGMMGFSSGAIVTMGALVRSDSKSRPNFVAAIYGAGMERFTTPAESTPLFILSAGDDPVASEGSVAAYSKWKAVGYPVELHMYAKGGHGFGMSKRGLPTDQWFDRFADWLREENLFGRKD
jgi:acetyl esterase/lipase